MTLELDHLTFDHQHHNANVSVPILCLGAQDTRLAAWIAFAWANVNGRLVDAAQVALINQAHHVASLTHVELSSQSRLSEPRSDWAADTWQWLEDRVDVVVVCIVRSSRIGVKVLRWKRALGVGRISR